jgi:hypothetical protein
MFVGRIFHFVPWSLSMVRAHGPGFTEIQDTPMTLTSGPLFLVNPRYWGLTKIWDRHLTLDSSPQFWYSPGPGAFALHLHRIFENIRASYELPITGRLQESS